MKYIRKIVKYILFYKRHRGVKYRLKNTTLNHKTVLEGSNAIGNKSNIVNSSIGFASYIGDNCYLPHARIGKYCSIASDVKIVIGAHPTERFVSTHPAFFSNKKQAGFTFVEEGKFKEINWAISTEKILVDVGNDVWIGNDVKILQGIRIGNGAIIATGTVVTKDIKPYSIVGGIPGKVIRNRFSLENEEFLNDLRWWDWKFAKIEKYSSYFNDIDELRRIIKN
ncbi:CatB-related O-acetyltransferase [Labilibaculum euxinus]